MRGSVLSAFRMFPQIMKDACPLVGGQAVIEGVMMRHGDVYAVAVRQPDGTILAEKRPWFSLARGIWKKPFLRGFPVLVETMVNGIKALNISAKRAAVDEEEEPTGWRLVLTMLIAVATAVALFVVTPHALSLAMQYMGLGGAVEGLSFHLWDGFFKSCIFVAYIGAISFVPDIQRVFQFHGAEHKVIHSFEEGENVSVSDAARRSRQHPRCGTTFILYVIALSILLHAVLVPLAFMCWQPDSAFVKHAAAVLLKLVLIIPISALAYELIRGVGGMKDTFFARIMRAPGLVLQLLTTREPSREHLEVALVALAEALGSQRPDTMHTPTYSTVEQ